MKYLLPITIILAWYSMYSTFKIYDYSDFADTYYENYCITEYHISKANPSDPVVLELQRIAKKYKICDGFMLPGY